MKKLALFSLIVVLSVDICWAADNKMPKVTMVKPVVSSVPVRAQEGINNVQTMGDKTIYFGKDKIPADYKNIPIMGVAVVTKEQALRYVQKNARNARLNCSILEIVDAYYEEATAEGIRPDLALCQALLETGMFSFTGTVHPEQNNFCGLGTTGKGVRGCKFDTPRDGVRAHIQHLLAYCRREEPKSKVVDPRYDLVHRIRMGKGLITKWSGLNGTWAMGANYCEKIMAHYMTMME